MKLKSVVTHSALALSLLAPMLAQANQFSCEDLPSAPTVRATLSFQETQIAKLHESKCAANAVQQIKIALNKVKANLSLEKEVCGSVNEFQNAELTTQTNQLLSNVNTKCK